MPWRITLKNPHGARRYDPPTLTTIDSVNDTLDIDRGDISFFTHGTALPLPVVFDLADVVKIERIDG